MPNTARQKVAQRATRRPAVGAAGRAGEESIEYDMKDLLAIPRAAGP